MRHSERLLGGALVGIVLCGSRARGDAREDSDVDLFVVARGLLADPFERLRVTRRPFLDPADPSISVRALTPGEWARDIAPIDLDIAVDGVVLRDEDGYVASRLALARRRIEEAGLRRDADLVWRWRRWPARRDWAVTWDGVRL